MIEKKINFCYLAPLAVNKILFSTCSPLTKIAKIEKKKVIHLGKEVKVKVKKKNKMIDFVKKKKKNIK